MDLELNELAVGFGLAVLLLLAFRFARIHRERGVYAILLICAALPYVMFAVETHEHDLINHLTFASIFSIIAFAGARWNLWYVVLGFIGHAIFAGTLHFTSLLAPTPGWYGPLCMGFELTIALGLAGFLSQGDKLSDMT